MLLTRIEHLRCLSKGLASQARAKFQTIHVSDGNGHPCRRSNLTFTSKPQEFVTICIVNGQSSKPYIVYKDVVCHASPYLADALASSFVEGETQQLTMVDVNPLCSGSFLQYAHTGKIKDKEGTLSTISIMVELWVLADRLMTPSLANLEIDSIHEEYKRTGFYTEDELHYIYKHTEAGSPLRKYFVAACAAGLNFTTFTSKSQMEEIPAGMWYELVVQLQSTDCSRSIRSLTVAPFHLVEHKQTHNEELLTETTPTLTTRGSNVKRKRPLSRTRHYNVD